MKRKWMPWTLLFSALTGAIFLAGISQMRAGSIHEDSKFSGNMAAAAPVTAVAPFSAKQANLEFEIQVPAIRSEFPDPKFEKIQAKASSSFLPSLELREQTDFIVLPSLLMQEWMDPDVIATCPMD